MADNTEEVKDRHEVKEQKETTVDKATNTETDKLYEDINKESKYLDIYHPICDSSRAQNASKEDEPNASDNLSSTEIKPCLDSGSDNAAGGKPSTKVMQQRQAIMADIVGGALLVVISCALKIHVKAVVVVGTVGIA